MKANKIGVEWVATAVLLLWATSLVASHDELPDVGNDSYQPNLLGLVNKVASERFETARDNEDGENFRLRPFNDLQTDITNKNLHSSRTTGSQIPSDEFSDEKYYTVPSLYSKMLGNERFTYNNNGVSIGQPGTGEIDPISAWLNGMRNRNVAHRALSDEEHAMVQKRLARNRSRLLRSLGFGRVRSLFGYSKKLSKGGPKGMTLSIDLGVKALRDALLHAKAEQNQMQAQKNMQLLHNIGKRSTW